MTFLGQVPVLDRLGGQPAHWQDRDGWHQQEGGCGGQDNVAQRPHARLCQ